MERPWAARNTATLSIRLVWALARVLHPDAIWRLLQSAGLSTAEYADPDTGVSHRTVVEWSGAALESSGDPTLGLRAGELIHPGDFDTLERALAACSTLREANAYYARYAHLMNEAAEIILEENAEVGILKYRITDGRSSPAGRLGFFHGDSRHFRQPTDGKFRHADRSPFHARPYDIHR